MKFLPKNEHFVKKLDFARRVNGMSHRAFAERLHVNTSDVTRLMRGNSLLKWPQIVHDLHQISGPGVLPPTLGGWLWPDIYEETYAKDLQSLAPADRMPSSFLRYMMDLRGVNAWSLSALLELEWGAHVSHRAIRRWLKGAPMQQGLRVLPLLGRTLRMPLTPMIPPSTRSGLNESVGT